MKTIEYVRNFYQESFQRECPYIFIADSALYAKETLLSKKYDIPWITRVPESITEAKVMTQKGSNEYEWQRLDDNYEMVAVISKHGGLKQRWFLIKSEDAEVRELATLEKKILKKRNSLIKDINKISKVIFKCDKDANNSLKLLKKKHPLFILEGGITSIYKNKDGKVGRPKRGEKELDGHRLNITYQTNELKTTKLKNSCGKFILGTNILSKEELPDDRVLAQYKQQSQVESCFRFLKSPTFHASDIYLKKPGRIEALMMIMTLSIMVYNLGQYHIRQTLKNREQTFPNQVGKKIVNPTLRWIFYCFKNIHISASGDITNLNYALALIVSFFGEEAMNLYNIRGKAPPMELQIA
jgi:transposase